MLICDAHFKKTEKGTWQPAFCWASVLVAALYVYKQASVTLRLCLLLRYLLDGGRKVIKELGTCQFAYGAHLEY